MTEAQTDTQFRRKVQIGFVIAVVVIILIMINLSSSKSEFSVQGVEVGDSIDSIEKKLGLAQDKISGYRYTYNGIEFLADDSSKYIETIRVLSPEYRTAKKIGIGSTLGQIVDVYGKDDMKMAGGDLFFHIKDSQVIRFNTDAYDSSELNDSSIVRYMDIINLGDHFQEEWDSLRPLEYQMSE